MDRNAEILKEVETLLAGSDIEVVDVETTGSRKGLVIRIYVDRPGGVSIDDCARLSRAVGDHFEAGDAMRGSYVLEVSSPGINRRLRRPADFDRFAGETAQVSTYEKIEGRNKHEGILLGFDPNRETVLIEDGEGTSWAIPLGAIKRANLKRDPWSPKEPG